MRVIEPRRHTMRVKPGDHLSQAGVDLARRVGGTMGRYDLVVIEDAAQAFGASYKGKRLGTLGKIGAYSFNIFKTINAGDGGMVVGDAAGQARIGRIGRDQLIAHRSNMASRAGRGNHRDGIRIDRATADDTADIFPSRRFGFIRRTIRAYCHE